VNRARALVLGGRKVAVAINDFEDHLENVALPWLSQALPNSK
jgi:hypothetical protein